ncbi:MAG: SIMPL domain-containing protein [Candidatus Competibacteraceae bacterium]|nr:SIMPL domain-containing protein [Candidatus Competibacteraceae bacterium]
MPRWMIPTTGLVFLVCGAAFGQPANLQEPPPTISVTGEAVVNVKPDKIVIRFGIETWDANIANAKEKNNEIVKKTIGATKALGVADKDVQTDHLSIEPRWKDQYHNDSFIGYFVRNSIVVTLNDSAKIEELVTKALQVGVNYIHGVDYETTELKKHREQARELALKAAAEKAEKMAAALGQSVGEPLQINESFSGLYGRHRSGWSGWGYGGGQAMSQNVSQNAPGGASEASETLALGTIAIRANVGVVFKLRR